MFSKLESPYWLKQQRSMATSVEGCCANDAVAFISSKLPAKWTPHMAIILGSGMGDVADSMTLEAEIPYEDIPDFPVSTVEGHQGKLLLGNLNGLNVACLQGRVHLYEGIDPRELRVPIYTMKLLGCEQLFLTTAVGSLLSGGVMPGDLVAISDHINLQARSPLIGANDPIGDRFVDMGNAYDSDLRRMLHSIAHENDIRLAEGVYAAFTGPAFETPAEVRLARAVGADIVGMSCVAEVLLARHCHLKVAAVAVVVNHAAGFGPPGQISHDETLHYSNQASDKMVRLIQDYAAATLKRRERFWKTI
jgi:xanthosine phosphorylase